MPIANGDEVLRFAQDDGVRLTVQCRHDDPTQRHRRLRRDRRRARKQYESIGFADVHGDILHLFPTTPSHVIDIGAGTGRDAAAFAERGHSVTAVEPTPELRAEASACMPTWPITWIDDSLPDLDRVHGWASATTSSC